MSKLGNDVELMGRHIRKTIATDHPRLVIQITDDGSRTLIHADTLVAYHSASGALAETKHVYLQNSGVATRLASGEATAVLEVGLGTAMGLLVTLETARTHHAPLNYTALELEWLPASLIRQLQPCDWITDDSLVERFLHWRTGLPDCVPEGPHHWQVDRERSVCVHVGRAESWQPCARQQFDAIYFDPFAPQSNVTLWQPSMLATMHSVLRHDGRLVSYCVSRKVRDALSAVGFSVRAVAGPENGKRDVLIATKSIP